MKRLLVFVCLFLVTSCGAHNARPLPWSKFSVMAKESVGAVPGACPHDDRAGIMVQVQHEQDVYIMWVLVDDKGNGTFVIAQIDKEGHPVYVWYGVSDPKDNDKIVLLSGEKFDPKKHSSPCAILAPERA
jgi:hypothetical protein